jgi:hypothetical protein
MTRPVQLKNRVMIVSDRCYACGVETEDLDHFPRDGDWGLSIPCCRDCKRLGSGRFSDDIVQRAKHIQSKMRAKYKRYLNTPEWSTEELSEVSEKFSREFTAFSRLSKEIRTRASWNYLRHIRSLDIDNNPNDISDSLGIDLNDPPPWWESIFPGY